MRVTLMSMRTTSQDTPEYTTEQADRALRRAVERERHTLRITEGQRRFLAERRNGRSEKPTR
jgi:hypothetical protein